MNRTIAGLSYECLNKFLNEEYQAPKTLNSFRYRKLISMGLTRAEVDSLFELNFEKLLSLVNAKSIYTFTLFSYLREEVKDNEKI